MQRKSFGGMPCPIARSLERVGEWWSILILRDAFAGITRFDEFQKSLGIAPNMLTRRLAALVEAGLLERRRYSERPPRDEYVLTAARARFPPGAGGLLAWGNRHFAPEGRERARSSTPRPAAVSTRCWSIAPPDGRSRAPDFTARARDRAAGEPHHGGGSRAGSRLRDPPPSERSRVVSAAPPHEPPSGRLARGRGAAGHQPRDTRLLLEGRSSRPCCGWRWPNMLVMLAQASTGLIETWWVSRLGTDALAGMALVFPGFMMMQMLSAGAMGGGISSAIARALGGRPARRRRRAGAARARHQRRARPRASRSSCWPSAGRSTRARRRGRRRSRRRCAYSNVVFAGTCWSG